MQPIPSIIGPVEAGYRVRDYDLGDISPETVKSLLRGVRTGKLEDQERLFRAMFDSWPRLQKNIAEVSRAVSRLEWSVQPYAEKGMDPTPEAQRMADVVELAIWGSKPDPAKWETDFVGAIKALLDAYAMGHSVLEVLWGLDQSRGIIAPRAYAPIPAKYYGYPSAYRYAKDPAGQGIEDELMLAPNGWGAGAVLPFPKDRFIIGVWTRGSEHPIHAALLRSLAKYWLGAYFGLGWLLQYSQLFGIPWRTIETDGSEKANLAAKQALEDLGAAGWGVLPRDTTLTIHAAPGGGESLPQKVVMDVADQACDILFLGQTLTTSQGDRGSQSLGTVHNGIRDDVLAAAGDWVAGVLTNQLVRSIIALNFGQAAADGPMPYLVAKMPEARDEKALLERVEGLVRLGVPLSKQWVTDQLGVPILGEGDELFVPARPQSPDPVEIPDDEDDDPTDEEQPEAVEAARKARPGKPRSGPRRKLWPPRSGVTSRK